MAISTQWITGCLTLCTFAIYFGMAAVYFTTYLRESRRGSAREDLPPPTTITPLPTEMLILWTAPMYFGRAAVYFVIINHHRPFVFLEALAILAVAPIASFLIGQPVGVVLKTILLVCVSDDIPLKRKEQILGLGQFVVVFVSCEVIIAVMSGIHILAPGMF